ncbi:hypothetical protein ACIP1U_11180 [Cupriavidus sp. NPDC089707]|uniref:hypothetical protein n=1 Tax=Cupriavidus sp. NPDC089707 TaxID=3363963 RepID=UPI003821C27B
MRDVTDNRTGELDVEVKRGRGRPRKPDAMTNAQRQAAYRARHRQSVTVTKNVPASLELAEGEISQLIAESAELRAELDATKAELAEAHETIDELNGYVNARDRENDHLVEVHDELVAVRRQLELAEQERTTAFAANAALQAEVVELNQQFVHLVAERDEALAAAKKGAAKSVTNNGNPVDFDFMLQVVKRVRSARDWRKRSELFDLDGWKRFNCSAATTDEMRAAFQDAITGDSTSRMIRNAKKRAAQDRNEKA